MAMHLYVCSCSHLAVVLFGGIYRDGSPPIDNPRWERRHIIDLTFLDLELYVSLEAEPFLLYDITYGIYQHGAHGKGIDVSRL